MAEAAAVTPGVETSEHAIASSTNLMGTILTYLGLIVSNAGLLTGVFGDNSKIGIFVGAGVAIAGILVKLFNSLGYTAGRSAVKAAASAAAGAATSVLVAFVVLLTLSGCAKPTAAQKTTIISAGTYGLATVALQIADSKDRATTQADAALAVIACNDVINYLNGNATASQTAVNAIIQSSLIDRLPANLQGIAQTAIQAVVGFAPAGPAAEAIMTGEVRADIEVAVSKILQACNDYMRTTPAPDPTAVKYQAPAAVVVPVPSTTPTPQ